MAVTLGAIRKLSSGLRLKMANDLSSGYSMLSANNPYIESGSSAVSVINVSIKILPEPAAFPLTIYLFKESKVPKAHVEISPLFGAFGFTYSK